MNKKNLKVFIIVVAAAIPLFTLMTPHFAYADCGLWGGNTKVIDCLFLGTSWIAELWFAAAGAILTLAGVLLNGTMVATLNIKTIVDATTAIGIAWRTIRDFSSIFIIFMLLYASILMILGQKDSHLGTLIKNIIIAGLLINFSLFITKFAVDTSNIISLSFYNAITPGQNVAPTNGFNGLITSAFNDGGISNVFMQSLSIQKIVATQSAASSTLNAGASDPYKNRTITLAYAGGGFLMITAAFSFLFAAVAFAVRIGVLILLMAFSPIYFIAMILPQAKEYADKWLKTLIAMCLFMPVYLILMYVAVSVINDPHFFDFAKVTTDSNSNSLISAGLVGIVLQYIIAFLFINAPMAAAIKIGSDGTDIAVAWGKSVAKWGQGQLTKGASGAWRETGGRAARALSESERFKDIAGKNFVGELALKGTRGVAANYNKALDTKVKSKTGFADSLGHNEKQMSAEQRRLSDLKNQLTAEKALGAGADQNVIYGLESNIRDSGKKIVQIDSARKMAYASRKGKNSLYNTLAASDAIAAAKVEVSIIEKQLTKAKSDLDSTNADIKSLNQAITNNQNRGGGRGGATQAQAAKQTELIGKLAKQTKTVNNFEDRISQLKLIK